MSQQVPYFPAQQQVPQMQQQTGQEPDVTRNLMVNYIPTTVDETQLRQLFERFGPIESVKIVCDRENRQSRGYGFVKFQSAASAQQAISNLNGFTILNKRLKVALAANGHQRNANPNVSGNGFGAYGGYGGYGGYGAYPATNPYAQQQMMAMQQPYMMTAPPMQSVPPRQ